jgi:hypothetical protein
MALLLRHCWSAHARLAQRALSHAPLNQAFHAMPRQPAHALVTFHPLRLPHALVRLSSTAVDAVGSAGAVEVTGDSLQYEPRPSYSRSARRARLHAALEACRAGGEFVVPPPEVTSIPGPCGAVMNVLRVYGPQETKPLFTLCEKHYPGAVKSLHHLRKRICNDALRNRLIKVRLGMSETRHLVCNVDLRAFRALRRSDRKAGGSRSCGRSESLGRSDRESRAVRMSS